MKPLFSSLAIILLVLVLGITSCTGQANQPPSTEKISETVQKMVDCMNAGDLEGSLAYFADDAMGYIVGLPPTGMEVYAGKEQIRTLWKDSIDNHFQWEIEITGVDGNLVFVKAKTWHDFTRQLGVAPLEYRDVYEIKDGKITTYGTTITTDALARFKPAFAEVMPPEKPAAPSTEQPVSEMAVTIAKATCTTNTPIVLQPGELTVTATVEDQDKERYALTFFTLDQGKDILDLMASTVMPAPPSWSNMFSIVELSPGKSKTYSINVKNGPVYMICWSQPPDLPIGNAGPFDVKE
jgi:ketosteroid isomerase-like protein